MADIGQIAAATSLALCHETVRGAERILGAQEAAMPVDRTHALGMILAEYVKATAAALLGGGVPREEIEALLMQVVDEAAKSEAGE